METQLVKIINVNNGWEDTADLHEWERRFKINGITRGGWKLKDIEVAGAGKISGEMAKVFDFMEDKRAKKADAPAPEIIAPVKVIGVDSDDIEETTVPEIPNPTEAEIEATEPNDAEPEPEMTNDIAAEVPTEKSKGEKMFVNPANEEGKETGVLALVKEPAKPKQTRKPRKSGKK